VLLGAVFGDLVAVALQLAPAELIEAEQVEVVLLMGDILYAPEQKQVPTVTHHRVPSARLHQTP
jgi:hypothetical protein